MTTVLDVGCGQASLVPAVVGPGTQVTGIDIIDQAPPHGYVRYVRADIRDLGSHFSPRSFDCVVALDVIEHLPKEDGHTLLTSIERLARRRVVVFTPNGFLSQEAYDDNPFQEHLSGWAVEELTDYGFQIEGVNGWRPIRGERADIRLRPSCLWARVSVVSQPLVVQHPRLAFQLLATKELME